MPQQQAAALMRAMGNTTGNDFLGLIVPQDGPHRFVSVHYAVLALPNVMQAWRGLRSPEEQQYYAVRAERRVSYAALYLGPAAFLAIMCEQLHAELPRAH